MGGEYLIIGCRTPGLLDVTLLLQVGENVEVDIEHVLQGPHLPTIRSRISAVCVLVRRQRQWYLIFVVVALVVTAQTDEDG